jgi:hypothetical protein
VAYDLFRRRQVPGNWALTSLTSKTDLTPLVPTPNATIDYLSQLTDQAKKTDVSVSKSGVKVARKLVF